MALLLILPHLLQWMSVRQVITALAPRHPAPRQPWREMERVKWAIDRHYRRRWLDSYGPCLRRALTLYYFLGHGGYPVSVALGAYLRDGQFVAHAWLTLQGQPIFESSEVSQYAVMAEWGQIRFSGVAQEDDLVCTGTAGAKDGLLRSPEASRLY